MTPNVWKMFTNPPSTLTFCPYLSWLNNLFMPNIQHTRMSSYAKNKLQMCWVTQHQCIRCQMCGNVDTLIHYIHFGLLQKMTGSSLNHLFMAKFQLMRMSTYAKNKLQMCAVTQHQCRRRQMCGKCSLIHPSSLTFCGLQKMTCPDWTI